MSDRRLSRPALVAAGPFDITPETFAAAPELAVLALLDGVLHVTRDALLAAQPSLLGEPPAWRVDPELVAARSLLRDAAKLERAIVHYRQCLSRRLHDSADRDDDLPF
jgi:hypothetical protein